MFKSLLTVLNNQNVVLASGSKSRQELLKTMGLKVTLCPSNFEENLNPSDFKSVGDFVEETALRKVLEVSERQTKLGQIPDIVIGADTVVTLEGVVFGKPKDENEAIEMLQKLSGRPNIVYTGVVIKKGENIRKFTQTTKVFITKLSNKDIAEYVQTKEPLDKAGSYAIQGLGGSLVEKIEGNYHNVMGLPLCTLKKELTELLFRDGVDGNVSN